MEVNKEHVMKEENKDDELYERIQAPKFFDFTKPQTDDDRYWFCSRLGCDQKHEEEINHEEISRNFVFRVLAARSPNIKLRKTLYKEHFSMKCPLSAPAKPSKPKIPRLAMDASLIFHNNGDPQSKNGPCSKSGATPVAKSRQVASKYMTTITTPRNKMSQQNKNSFLSVEIESSNTNIVDPHNKTGHGSKVGSIPVVRSRQVAARYMTTPRKKMSQPNHNSFLSVPDSKATVVDVSKSRKVAKGLVFCSLKKGVTREKSIELHTPLTRICEGMKRLEIASQKKTFKDSRSKLKKPETEDSSRNLKICKSEKMDLGHLTPSETNKKTSASHEQVVDVKFSDDSSSEFCKKEENFELQETSDTSDTHALRAETNDLSNIVTNKTALTSHEQVVDVKLSDGSASEFSEKEEHLQPQETFDTSDSHALRAEMNDLSNIEVKENIESPEHQSNVDGKENASNAQDNNRSNKQPFGDKILRLRTNVKPFRLRTDERGILKEGILERKLHLTDPEKEVAKDTCVIKRTYRVPKNEKLSTSDNCGEVSRAVGSKSIPINALRCPESTQQRSMTSTKTRSQSVRMPGQQLGVIENSYKLTSDVKVVGNTTRAVSATRSKSRGKWLVTVGKEPNFHTSHLPRTCSKKIA